MGFGPAADGVEARYSAARDAWSTAAAAASAAAPAVRRVLEPIATDALDFVDLQALVDPNTVRLRSPPDDGTAAGETTDTSTAGGGD